MWKKYNPNPKGCALDEHMDVIKLLHPKEYDTLIQKIRELA